MHHSISYMSESKLDIFLLVHLYQPVRCNIVLLVHQSCDVSHRVQAFSGQQYDEEAQQSACISTESLGQIGTSPTVTANARASGANNSPASQPSLVAAEALADGQHFVPTNVNVHEQQQTTASNDGLVAAGSYDTQDAAAASVHATALDEDLPASDAETDLSSIGLQHGRRHAQSRHTLAATNTLLAYACKPE